MKKVFMTLLAVISAASMMADVTPYYGIEFGYDHGSVRAINEAFGMVPTIDKLTNEYEQMAKMDGFHVGGNVQLDFMDGPHIPSLVIGLNYQFLNNNLYNTNKDLKEAKKKTVEAFKEMQKEADGKMSNLVLRNDITLHTIQLPIRAQYAYQINDEFRVFAYTGPQLRFHVAMTMSTETSYKMDGKKYGKATMDNLISGRSKEIEWENGKKYSEEYIPNFSKGTAKYIFNDNGEKHVEEENIDKDGKDELMQWFDMSWGFGIGCAWNNLSLNISYDLGMMNIWPKAYVDAVKKVSAKRFVCNSDALAVTIGYRF